MLRYHTFTKFGNLGFFPVDMPLKSGCIMQDSALTFQLTYIVPIVTGDRFVFTSQKKLPQASQDLSFFVQFSFNIINFKK